MTVNITIAALNKLYGARYFDPASIAYEFPPPSADVNSAKLYFYSCLSLFQSKPIVLSYQSRSHTQSTMLNHIWDSVQRVYMHQSFSKLFSSFFYTKGIIVADTNATADSGPCSTCFSVPQQSAGASYSYLNSLLLELYTDGQVQLYTHTHNNLECGAHSSNQLLSYTGLDADVASASMFSYLSKVKVVPLVADRASLPVSINKVAMLTVLPSNIATLYSTPDRCLLPVHLRQVNLQRLGYNLFCNNGHGQYRDLNNKPMSYGGDKVQYVKLIRRMHQVDMVKFTRRPIVVNSVFAVEKDLEFDRIIIDARVANANFIDCPMVKLPNPAHLASIRVPTGYRLVVAKSDLSDFYHNISIPAWMQPYLCLPPLSEYECGIGPSTDVLVYPCCTTLPMGFSHSVYIAQCIHEHILYSNNVLSPAHNIVNLSNAVIAPGQVVHAIYIDDLGLLSVVRDDGQAALNIASGQHVISSTFDNVLHCYHDRQFPPKYKKVVYPTIDPVTLLGMLLHGSSISPDTDKLLSLISQTVRVVNSHQCTGIVLAQIIGSWTWNILLRRSAFSLLRNVYKFVVAAEKKSFVLWKSVKRELLSMIAVVPMLFVDLSSTFGKHLVATDASTLGAGVMVTDLTSHAHDRMWPVVHSQLQSTRAESQRWGVPHHRTFSQQFMSVTSHHGPVDKLYQPCLYLTPRLDNPRSFTSHLYGADVHWRRIISYRWKYDEHINVLEARAMLLSLRWLCSSPTSNMKSTCFSITDSSSVYYSLVKGRSSARLLYPVICSINALLLASSITVLPVWVPSRWNPADAASRLQ